MKKMLTKKIVCCLLMTGMTISFTSCTVSHHHHHTAKKIPPGQAKKMTGSKSAKRYAPGHNK
ncbi:hypothetical protein FEDK69T_10660 [Flavobacterium enshiense DK69]|nr:hypothetical protein FEDK69T_10660 [Flavobacterium enshiense DK69]